MRKNILIATIFAYFTISAFADSDCTVFDAPNVETWCPDCYLTISTEVCSNCQDVNVYASLDVGACVQTNCDNIDSMTVNDSNCADCFVSNVYANYNGSACTEIDCSAEPEPYTSVYCMTCDGTNNYANNDGSGCASVDCSEPPTPLTSAYCSACEPINSSVNEAGDACVAPAEEPIDCETAPASGSYSNEWCNECNDGADALEDLSSCVTETDDTTDTNSGTNTNDTNSSTTNNTTVADNTNSGSIFCVISSIIFLGLTI